MPRTQLPNLPAVSLSATASTSQLSPALNQAFTAADVANGNYFVASGRDMVEIYNSDTAPHNLSVVSAPDACTGRKADIVAYAIPASTDATTHGHVSFIVLPGSIFTQTDGTVQLSADNALVFFSIRSL